MADLERALCKDYRCYKKACALIKRELGDPRLRKSYSQSEPISRDIQRYFGLGGFREHTAKEIAVLRGLSPKTRSEIPRRIKRFLSKRIGPDNATELIVIRSRFGRLRARKEFSEVKKFKTYINGVLSVVDFTNDFRRSCIGKHFGLSGTRMLTRLEIAREADCEVHLVDSAVNNGLASLIGPRKAHHILKIRNKLNRYLSRAIKAQAVRLQLAAGRRVSAILETPIEPKVRVRLTEGRRIVEIQFRARKTWGDEGILEWVPCVDRFGEIAQDAIRNAQELTNELREFTSDGIKNFLFIVPSGKSTKSPALVSTAVLEKYLYSTMRLDDSLLRRYRLKDLSNFSLHHIRCTHSTHMIEAGGTIHDVAHYLGHTRFHGSTTMAGCFYLAGGTEPMRQRTVDALRTGAATGFMFDGLARIKIEAIGSSANAAGVPPNELSFEEARQRIQSADILEDVPASPAEAASLLKNQKTIINITRYGGCLLQATSGPCPTANPCAIGILPRGVEPTPGCGCKYLVLLPDSVEQLSRDIAAMEAQVAEMKGDQWEGWRSHTEAKLSHYRSLLETAKVLNASN